MSKPEAHPVSSHLIRLTRTGQPGWAPTACGRFIILREARARARPGEWMVVARDPQSARRLQEAGLGEELRFSRRQRALDALQLALEQDSARI